MSYFIVYTIHVVYYCYNKVVKYPQVRVKSLACAYKRAADYEIIEKSKGNTHNCG